MLLFTVACLVGVLLFTTLEPGMALVHRIEHMAKPDYLTELHAFRDGEGELRRLTDERHQAPSPLRREAPDLGARTFHGLRMIAEDRSRFAVRPFESAQGKLLLEVNPTLAARRLLGGDDRDGNGERPRVEEIVRALVGASLLPIDVDARALHLCRSSRDALDALLAARCAALAVVTGEADRSPDDLAPGEAQRVRREGWIYGLA